MDGSSKVKICFFPGRESTYARTRSLIKAMEDAGITVLDCSSPTKSRLRYLKGFLKFLKYKNQCDVVFVGFLGHFLVPIIKLFTRKKILFDAFVSIYQTLAFDRKSINPKSPLSTCARFIDRFACQLSDTVFLDTDQNINYYIDEYHLPRSKFQRLLPGSDDSVMFPHELSDKESEFIVHFHGEFQPLHGTPHIVETAKLLPDIKFQMIGKGKDLKICEALVKKNNITNINFISTVTFNELSDYIARASVCLGLFGDTIKTQSVIPHKVYEALAMRKAVITSDTPAVRELLTDRQNVVFCKTADPKSLAEAIVLLKNDPELRKRIADNGYKLFKEKCSPAVLGQQILKTSKVMAQQ